MLRRRLDAARPIRVAHVAPGLDVGGLETLLVEFGRHADRDRFRLRVVSLTARGLLADEVEACGWPVTALEKPPGLRPGLALRLAGLFRRWGTDVVHTHNNGPLIYGAPGAWLARVPRVVHTRHEQNVLAGPRELAALRHAARLVDRFVCVSEDSARLSREQGVRPSKLRTVWNGVDTARFTRVGPWPDGPAVAVARLSPEKDVANLVRAAAIVVRERPTFQVEVAGQGPCLPDLVRLVDELGLGEHVAFLGEVRDVPGLLGRAGLFVLPSLTEGIPVTVLEAMARGLPVVATRVGGTPEVVVDGQTGRLVPPGDPAALARALLDVASDPERARRMGLAGRRRVEEHFDVRRMVADYEALYTEGAPPGLGHEAGAGDRPAGRAAGGVAH